MNSFPMLTAITALPFIGGLTVTAFGGTPRKLARPMALAFAFATLAMVGVLSLRFETTSGQFVLEERHSWIRSLAVEYHLGMDGLGWLMVLLTALVVPMALLASSGIRTNLRLYYSLVLFLEAGLMGTFTALNFVHWFLYWELSLIPAFFLIKLWGGPLRTPAATQFFVYTMAGSVALLLAFVAIALATGTFDFIELTRLSLNGRLAPALASKLGWYGLTAKRLALVIFSGAFLGFAVKVPLVPFHTWLPAAYTEAPPPVVMLLTGLMSKMGLYGMIRIVLPVFCEEIRWTLKPLLVLAVITIVASGAAALAQRDLKRILAYSSINHLGYCLLGIFAVASPGSLAAVPSLEKTAALNGVFLQMFNHGLTAATLFWFVGLLESRSAGLRGLDDFGGLRKVAPVFTGLIGIALFSSLGLPGLNGFVGEFLIFKGAFPLVPWAAGAALAGLLLTALFVLGILQKVFSGPLNPKWAAFPDLKPSEVFAIALPIGLMFVLGIYPQVVLRMLNGTTSHMVASFGY
jgi:NADH-quinone oxidoreductase subunit M